MWQSGRPWFDKNLSVPGVAVRRSRVRDRGKRDAWRQVVNARTVHVGFRLEFDTGRGWVLTSPVKIIALAASCPWPHVIFLART